MQSSEISLSARMLIIAIISISFTGRWALDCRAHLVAELYRGLSNKQTEKEEK